MTRAMEMWRDFDDWTPPELVVELVAAIAAGKLDAWSGRFVRAGKDDLETLRGTTPDSAARRLRLQPVRGRRPARLTTFGACRRDQAQKMAPSACGAMSTATGVSFLSSISSPSSCSGMGTSVVKA